MELINYAAEQSDIIQKLLLFSLYRQRMKVKTTLKVRLNSSLLFYQTGMCSTAYLCKRQNQRGKNTCILSVKSSITCISLVYFSVLPKI